jgi:hypothetical protein
MAVISIPAAVVSRLVPKVEALAGAHCSDPDMDQFMRGFEAQTRELVRRPCGWASPCFLSRLRPNG